MLKIRLKSHTYLFDMTDQQVGNGMTVSRFRIMRIVSIPKAQIDAFRKKQYEDNTFNGQLLKALALAVLAPYTLGPVNTSPKTGGCKSCARFVVSYSSQNFPTTDKFEALQAQVQKVQELLRKIAQC